MSAVPVIDLTAWFHGDETDRRQSRRSAWASGRPCWRSSSVSGVFDLAESYFGDGETDLARTLCSSLDEDPGSPARSWTPTSRRDRPGRYLSLLRPVLPTGPSAR